MSVLAEASAQQSEAAAKRVGKRTSERRDKIDAITSGKLVAADEPVRIASRIERLSRYYPGVRPVSPAALEANDPKAVAEAGAVLERIINTPDFVDVRYLEAGSRASHAVGRVDIRDHAGRVIGFGTGSLVTSRLLLTNHHVLPDAETAAASEIEFNFEDGVDGQPLKPVAFPLDPTTFFLADEKLDFALVAVGGSPQELAAFGYNPPISAQGKAIAGDFITIVQHPEGQKKQVALRDNRVVDVLDDFLHYEADTQPGSSGSPVFNDQWELVALHHASVPAPDHPELGKFVNEGIRVSQLLAFIGKQVYTDQQRALVADLVGSPAHRLRPGRQAGLAASAVPPAAALRRRPAPCPRPTARARPPPVRITRPRPRPRSA